MFDGGFVHCDRRCMGRQEQRPLSDRLQETFARMWGYWASATPPGTASEIRQRQASAFGPDCVIH